MVKWAQYLHETKGIDGQPGMFQPEAAQADLVCVPTQDLISANAESSPGISVSGG